MKKLLSMTAILAAILSSTGLAYAADVKSDVIPVSAEVDSQLSLDIVIKAETDVDADGDGNFDLGNAVTSMDHGKLKRSNNPDTGEPNALRGKAFHVFLGPNTSSRSYTVKHTMTELKTGAGDILPHALGVFPIIAKRGTTNVGTLATKRDAVGTDLLLYTSDAAGDSATIELVYGLSGGPSPFTGWIPIPPDQKAGTYTGTLQFTLTA